MSPIYWGYSWKIFTKQQQHRHSKHHAAQIQTQTITWINKPQPKANSCTEDTLYSGQHITNIHQLTGIGNQKFSFLWKHLLARDRSLPDQPISIRKAQSRKKAHKPLRTSWVSQKKSVCYVWKLYNFVRINKPLAYRCLVCISCSVHVISTYYVRKGSWAFYLNYPQSNEVGNPITWWDPGPRTKDTRTELHPKE